MVTPAAGAAAGGAAAGGTRDIMGVGTAISGVATAAGKVGVRFIDEISEVLDSFDRPSFNYEITWKTGKQVHEVRLNVSKLDVIILLSVAVIFYIGYKYHVAGKSGAEEILLRIRPLQQGFASAAKALSGAVSGSMGGAGEISAEKLIDYIFPIIGISKWLSGESR